MSTGSAWPSQAKQVEGRRYEPLIQLVIGLGPALRVRVGADYVGEGDDLKPPKIEEVTITAIAPNERTENLKLQLTYPAPDWAALMTREFRIIGSYQDRAGRGEYEIEQPIVELTEATIWRQ
jgi:hypothetical protein